MTTQAYSLQYRFETCFEDCARTDYETGIAEEEGGGRGRGRVKRNNTKIVPGKIQWQKI